MNINNDGYDEAIDCKFIMDDMRDAGRKGFAVLEEFCKTLKNVEDEMNKKDILKVPFSKIMKFENESEYTLSVEQNEDTTEQKMRIYLTITDYGPDRKLFHRPLMQCKIAERLACIPIFYSFMESYYSFYVNYINTLFDKSSGE